jgi:hypothetical protein
LEGAPALHFDHFLRAACALSKKSSRILRPGSMEPKKHRRQPSRGQDDQQARSDHTKT